MQRSRKEGKTNVRVLGCDIGTSDTKVVVFEDGKYVCGAHGPTEALPDQALERVLDMLRRNGRLGTCTKDETIVTGWGEPKLSRPHRSVTQINCMRKAALWAEPSCRAVLNLGAQQSIAMSLNRKGRLLEYKVSDKCASGAGRFLEIIVEALGCTLEEIAALDDAYDAGEISQSRYQEEREALKAELVEIWDDSYPGDPGRTI